MSHNQLKTAQDLESLFQNYNSEIFAYLMTRLRTKEVAEDLTQDVFIKAWQKREQFNPAKGSIKNWLYAIALNAARDYWRANKLKTVEQLPEDVPTAEDIPLQTDQRAMTEFILKHLRSLSEKEQELLTLRFTQGLKVEEISQIMELKYSATKVALHRATEKLKKRCNRFLA